MKAKMQALWNFECVYEHTNLKLHQIASVTDASCPAPRPASRDETVSQGRASSGGTLSMAATLLQWRPRRVPSDPVHRRRTAGGINLPATVWHLPQVSMTASRTAITARLPG